MTFIKGHKPWNKGKSWKKKSSTKISKICEVCSKKMEVYPHLKDKKRYCSKQCKLDWMSKSFRGENHWRWKGGQKRYRHCGGRDVDEWRTKVFERDNWTCQTCRSRGVYLEAHHIKSWAKYPELRFIVENGVTLCLGCHKLTDNYKGKK